MRQIKIEFVLAAAGIAGAIAAVAIRPQDARLAAVQDWPPFVLVAGLLLVGLVADDDGLFAACGHQLARLAPSGLALFSGAVILVGVVTSTLNLDTSVAFLTPVLVYTARSRGGGEAALVYGCLLLSNAGSLLLPGSNLTNLIVLGHLHLSGGQFAARMWLPFIAALLVTAIVIAVLEHGSLTGVAEVKSAPDGTAFGVGLPAVVVATVLVLTLSAPAIPVALTGLAAAGIHLARRRTSTAEIGAVLGVPVLVGLFGIAVALGTLGRASSGPAELLARLDSAGVAAVAAAATVLVNNLPAASLLAARTPPHPFALLVGLNLGPNLAVTGSLAWLLWLRSARRAGAAPSLRRASLIGAVAVPLSMAAALAALALTAPGK